MPTDRRLKRKVNREITNHDPQTISGKPRITSMLPISPFASDLPPGIIVPGAIVALKGQFLGNQPGEIMIKGPTTTTFGAGHAYGEIPLVDLKWTAPDRIQGRVPNGIILPTQRTSVKVWVKRADGQVSPAYPGSFQVPSETRWLLKADVQVDACGEDSNGWYCNGEGVKGQCQTGFSTYWTEDFADDPESAIQGYHENCNLAVGDDAGTDTYRITLRDGWVFDHIEWQGPAPSPSFPVGGSHWVPSVRWVTESGDEDHYYGRIRVRRAVSP